MSKPCATPTRPLLAGLNAAPALATGVQFNNVPSTAASPVHVEMAVDGMEVKPAADGLKLGTGHFHVLIDLPQSPPEGDVIPFDDMRKHYGKGQTAADIELAPVRAPSSLLSTCLWPPTVLLPG